MPIRPIYGVMHRSEEDVVHGVRRTQNTSSSNALNHGNAELCVIAIPVGFTCFIEMVELTASISTVTSPFGRTFLSVAATSLLTVAGFSISRLTFGVTTDSSFVGSTLMMKKTVSTNPCTHCDCSAFPRILH